MKTKWIWISGILLMMLTLPYASCAETDTEWSVMLEVTHGTAELHPTILDDEYWLFLPAFAMERNAIEIWYQGNEVVWQELSSEESIALWQTANGTCFHVMQSKNLRALFLVSDEPDVYGRAYLDNAAEHETFQSGSMAMIDLNGRVDHVGKISKMRGRGNFTWQLDKKAYQFKLEEKADLLKTGKSEEWNNTWILLADGFDGTMLHNRITMDLALEMGISNTSRCEHVDMYFDGEYRGLYLLTEKVEAGEGRLGVAEYDKWIESWNEAVGQYDLDSLPVSEGVNRFGNVYTYIEGLAEAGTPKLCSYVLEMEHEKNTLSDRCWFRMADGSVLACQNPQNASESMMRYISERLEEARETLQNGGVHPENGRMIEDDFDLNAFAKHMLIAELSYNADTYRYASTWFVLPAGSMRFEPGTVWDFDLAYRYRKNGENANGAGLRDQTGWMAEFYSCPTFVEEMKRVYANELLPILRNVLLGNTEGQHLKPLDAYTEEIAASRLMNAKIWNWVEYSIYDYGNSLEEEYALFRRFLTERSDWLENTLLNARSDAERIDLWAYTGYLRIEEDLTVQLCPWNHAEVKNVACRQLTEATETDYALWELTAVLHPKDGYAFVNPMVVMNGTELAYKWQGDGSLQIRATFEDPSYRPVNYDGDDIGLVFNPDFYAEQYPEIAARYENDLQGLISFFCDVGMEEGHQGNVFFHPETILQNNQELEAVLGTDWFLYYWDFIDFGFADGWMESGGRGFMLQIRNAIENISAM